MILTDTDIKNRIGEGDIVIEPFDLRKLGSNSYDVTLGEIMGIYENSLLDCKKDNPLTLFKLPEEGSFILHPGILYLGVTNEMTDVPHNNLIPMLEGKSSLARLGIQVHMTAGFGDVGFKGHWTLEITVVHPTKIYKNMPIAQVYFTECNQNCENPYSSKSDAKYANQPNRPVGSKMFENKF